MGRAQRSGGPKRVETNVRGAYRRQGGNVNGRNRKRGGGKKRGGGGGAGGKTASGSGAAFSEERMRSNKSKNDPAAINVAELTKNFQQGTELQRLRAELAQSQASLAGSNSFLTKAKDWFK